MFAAAHLKANDKSAARGGAGLTDKAFVEFCFGRATEPVPPIGSTFGAKVYEASISPEGKKGPAFAMDDEPRGGDGESSAVDPPKFFPFFLRFFPEFSVSSIAD